MSLFTNVLKRGVKFIPKKVPKMELPKVKIPKLRAQFPKMEVPKVPVPKAAPKSIIPNIPTKKILTVGGLAGAGYVGYQGALGIGNLLNPTPSPTPPYIPEKLPEIPQVPEGWTPEDMMKFFRGLNPQDEHVGGWEELGGGLGNAAEAIPKAVGENILPLAAVAGVIILITQYQKKPKRK